VTTTAAFKTLSESSSSGRGADDDEEEKITGIGEDKEEEKGNPLQETQQPEQALDQDYEALQQLDQQLEEDEVDDTAMSKECNMTPRLQFWYRNSEDRTSIEWWCDAVDRIRDQKGWNNEQGKKLAALVAVDSLREEAALLMSIIAKGHQAAVVKGWSLMKPLLIKRYSTIKTCTQRAKQFATITQKSGEPVENLYDRTQMAMIIVHKKPRAAIPVAEVDRLRGYNECADGTQALLWKQKRQQRPLSSSWEKCTKFLFWSKVEAACGLETVITVIAMVDSPPDIDHMADSASLSSSKFFPAYLRSCAS
jgi:hypothetical protein